MYAVNVYTSNKLLELRNRAKTRINSTDLRHSPKKSDVLMANQNTKDLILEEFKTIKE